MTLESIQAEINLLHKQLDAKQIELDNKYAERKAFKSKAHNVSTGYMLKVGNIESNFKEDMMNDMFNEMDYDWTYL